MRDDPDKATRAAGRARATTSLDIQTLFGNPSFITRQATRLPDDQEFPLWWTASLLFFQLNVRALMGETKFASNSGVYARDLSVLRRIFAFLPNDSYHDSSVEADRLFVDLFLASTGATLLRRSGELPARILPVSLRQLKAEGPFLDDLAAGRIYTWGGTFALHTYAALPEKHPVRRFLAPFMRYTLGINRLAQELIINPRGALAGQVTGYEGSVELMRRMEARASYVDVVLPRDLEARGMRDFPGEYAYRDDGLLCWEAIAEFAKARVSIAYADDESVVTDSELQAWAHDISRTIAGFPSPISTREALAEAMTAGVYSALLHVLHNAPSADHTIIPGHPASLASTVRDVPLPRFKGDGPKDLWRHADLGNVIITLLFDATLVPYNQRLVTTFELDRYCTRDDERATVRDFVARAEKISSIIQERNASRSLPFPYFDMVHRAAQSVNS